MYGTGWIPTPRYRWGSSLGRDAPLAQVPICEVPTPPDIPLYIELMQFPGWLETPVEQQGMLPPTGFGGISQRHGKKPILAAVNGLAVGGGVEVLVNCDMVICSPKSVLCLPDVKVGLSLLGGTIPLLVRKIGRSRASDMIFTVRNVKAPESLSWGVVDRIVDDPLKATIDIARAIAGNSPDAVRVSREGIFMALREGDSFELGKQWKDQFWGPVLRSGRNAKEGTDAFVQKRKPNWDREWEKTVAKL